MKKIVSGFLVLALLAVMILPVLPTPAAAATLSRYCVLVLDVSGSETFTSYGVQIYQADTAIEHVKTSAMRFLEDLLYASGNNYIALVTYDDEVVTRSGFTNDIQSLQQQVNSITAGNNDRDIASGLTAAKNLLDEVSDVNATKNVVLFTTGMTDAGEYDYDGFYDSNTVGSSWRSLATNVRLYAYANSAIAASAELKETATIYTLGLFQTMAQIPAAGKDIAEFFRITTRDLASSEDCFFDASNPSELEFAFAEIAEDITIEPKLFKYAGQIDQEKDTEAEYYYHDNYFFKPSSLYNPSLATMSLCLELSCWSSWEKRDKWYNPDKPNDLDDQLVNIKTLLMGNPKAGEGYEGIGFQNFDANEYWEKEPETNSIGVCAAQKSIEDKHGKSYTLIAVAIRGGGYYSEWGGNFVVGEEGEHDGFAMARDEVVEFLTGYISKLESKENIKLWIVGFSRAGAVANMVAGALDDNSTLLGPDIEQNNIFCYTFEAPQGVLYTQTTGAYRNIHNVLNANDLVPMVAPSAWGFVRYNYTNTTYLPTRYTTESKLFEKQLGAMQQELTKMGFGKDNKYDFEYKISEYSTLLKLVVDRSLMLNYGIPVWTVEKHTTDTHVALREGVDLAALLLGGRSNYAQELQPALSKLLSIIRHYDKTPGGMEAYAQDLLEFFSLETMVYIMAPIFSLNPFYSQQDRLEEVLKRTYEKTVTIFDELVEVDGAIDAITNVLKVLMSKIATDASMNNTDSIDDIVHLANVLISSEFQGHYPEICLAWCRSLDPNYNTDITQEPDSAVTRIIRINCPVDVFVYDKNDQLVASIVDDTPGENNTLVCYLNENGEKLFYLPANGDYRLDIQATDEGEVHYSVGEYSLAYGKMVYLENYYSISVSSGDTLTAEAPAATREALKENALSGTGTNYTLLKNNRSIYADEVFNGTNSETLYRTISVNTQGNGGYAVGAGTFVQGSMAQVEAFTLPNGSFIGWQDANGTLLSTDAVYRFPVQNDISITAVFSDVTFSELTISNSKGGHIEADSGHFPEGMEITMVAVPKEGYEFVGWNTSAGMVEDEKAAETVFHMPGKEATVTAKFQRIDDNDDRDPKLSTLRIVFGGILAVLCVVVVTIIIAIVAAYKRKA